MSQWLAQLFHTLLRFIMPRDDPEMRVFSKATDPTNASLLLGSLKENLPFLKDGLGNIIVTQVEYCKCRKGSAWEHEFLVVTLKELARAGRTALLLVDRLMDDTKEYAGGQDGLLADVAKHQSEGIIKETTDSTDSNSVAESESIALPAAQQWASPSRIQSSAAKIKRISKGDPPNALDRLIILRNKRAIAKELGNCPADVLMTMDLTRSQIKVTLERFTHLLRTTSRNTPQYHYIFAQCYWYAYTIWKVLEMETQPVVLGKGEFVNMVRSPETIKAQWEAERPTEDEEWAKKKQALHEDARREAKARREAEEGRREAEEGRRQAETRVRELQRRVESLERSAPSAIAV
ncbi:uncharacterized protein ARMOST_06628 [Armillaria ostoyae]|uniref:Uncharacterized protein n=1 Tax=Armillaria ostoyae TaxID=47428 RepID=A0A284R3J6_ARMOS|nr:uncharacterized protein ARMOST_06628 [Armillaria ostoyae]